MLLASATILTGTGFAMWIAGAVLDYPGVGVLGALLVLGVGVTVMDDGGLDVKTGEVQNVTDNGNVTDVEYQYSEVGLPGNLELGFILVLLSTLLLAHSFLEF